MVSELHDSDRNNPIAISTTTSEPRTNQLSLNDRVRSLRLPDRTSKPGTGSRKLNWFLGILCVGLGGALAYVGFEYDRANRKLQEVVAENETLAAPAGLDRSRGEAGKNGAVRGSDQQASSGEVVHERKGYIIPAHQILISPKVSGMIEKLYIEEGQRVKSGEILAQLESIDYKADYDRAVATYQNCWQRWMELYSGHRPLEIKQAKSELEEMEATKEQLYLEWKRNRGLSTNSALATREYEQAAGSYKAMERRVDKLRQAYQLMLEGPREERIAAAWAEVVQADAEVQKSKWRLDNCSIRAPVSGTILIKRAEIGNLVNPMAMQGSFSLCEMADLSDLEVELKIEERDVSKIFKGQKCRIRCDAFPERPYDGIVSRLMPTADRANSAIPVRVKLFVPREEEGVYLKPEMGAVVNFLKKSDKE